ncbi:MAG: aminotransferase class I/II-fold pyridoxal phosphate-dependent enzyme [Coraliomargaritaceae bacterium]
MSIDKKNTLPRKGLQCTEVLAEGTPQDPYLFFDRFADITHFAEFKKLDKQFRELEESGINVPYFLPNEGSVRDITRIDGKEYISFSGYNYLGLAGDPRVNDYAIEKIQQYGTTVSASRIASGERPLHTELETALADFLECESALTFVSGHATNVSVIEHLTGSRDLIVYDELAHNCILSGIALSGAKSISFAHNDAADCKRVLETHRKDYERVLIAIEGVYSMDGDIAPLDEFVELKRTFRTFLLVDEAHSVGVLGPTGKGIGQLQSIQRDDVDLWMGTFSKALASCGGYIAGKKKLIRYLRYTTPGFVYSVGISPANAAAALKSLELIQSEPERIQKLHENADYFLYGAQRAGFSTGSSQATPIIPIILGDRLKTLLLSQALFDNGINVQPIIPPAVPFKKSRIRFFITSCHTKEQLDYSLNVLAKSYQEIARK